MAKKPFLNADCVFKFNVIPRAANEQVIAAKMNVTRVMFLSLELAIYAC